MASTDAILAGKYPAKNHARRVAEYLRKNNHHEGKGVLYLEAQKTRMIEDNDGEVHFRQRRPFFYLSGCDLPDSYVTYNIEKDELTLFIPPIDPDSVIWSGLPLSPADAQQQYDVDKVLPSTDVNATLAHAASEAGGKLTVFAIADQVSPETTFLPFSTTNLDVLKNAIGETRVVKDDYEIALLRRANDISTKAHIAVLRAAKKATNERELYATFLSTCIAHGAPEMSYHPIMAAGTSGATLHYQKNDASLFDEATGAKKLNLLIDAGGEYRTYCADITRAFPLSGQFTPESRQIYDIVLKMQATTLAALKEGVLWDDIHLLAHRVAVEGLLNLGILRGGSVDELLEKRITAAFFPHGLGHYLGMDTHDTGGNPNHADKDIIFKYLRLRNVLPSGSVVTVEPGIYFCRFIIDPYLASPESSKYIDKDVLERYWSVGGVRIEDNVVITKDGHDNLTTTPKEVDDVLRYVNEG
ncbi:hypothetical protein FQN54_000941 [Arachnomyces sp. PD_36]|nr:hypothetical protein FQN54_000941 [Arachnomyces sp. PD_36]